MFPRAILRTAFAVGFVFALWTLPAQAEDWPRWRGPRLDGISQEAAILTQWPADGPKRLWRAGLSGGFSSFAVAEGSLFTLTREKEKKQEVILCFDAASGKETWRYPYDCDYSAHKTLTGGYPPGKYLSGPRATPAFDQGRIYTLGATGTLLCLDAKTGQKIWQQELLEIGHRACPSPGYCASPLIVGDRIYVQPGGPDGKSIAALDKKDGRVIWQGLDDPVGFGSPIWADTKSGPQIIFFTGKAALGVAPEKGKLLWRYPWKTQFELNIATPIYADGKVFISSNYGSGGALFQIKENGEPETVWTTKAMQNHCATSVLYQGHLYGVSGQRLRCIDFATGKTKWDKSGLGMGTLILAGDHLIVLGEHGELVLAKADSTEYREVARCQVFEKNPLTMTVPVLSDGRLFLRSEYALTALDISGRAR
jgi:outer membrane protein assembly factor BamB